MKKHFRYLSYVLRHKWYVFVACWRIGIVWRGITHDLSKFSPSEWDPYVEHFYGEGKRGISEGRDKTGGYDPNKGSEIFKLAWNHHQKHNRHHWEWWLSWSNGQFSPTLTVLEMDDISIKEMIADWIGASRAQKTRTVMDWWEAHKRGLGMCKAVHDRVVDLMENDPVISKMVRERP